MSENGDQAAVDRDWAEYAARIERSAAMFLAALITTENDMTHREKVELALTYAKLLAAKVEMECEP